MLVMRTIEDRANSIGKLVSAEQSLGLCDLAFAVDPLRLYCVEPGALAKRIWQRRRTKASEEGNSASRASRSSFESVRTKIGGSMSTTVTHNSQPVLKMH
jgi:hypothetical protein